MLRFRLFGIPVGIHLSFLLIALFGYGRYRGADLIAWVVGVGVAVLSHEAGHALTARAYGAKGITVTLFALGGFTTWAPGERPIGPRRRFVVAASGSAVGIALGGAILLAHRSGLVSIPRGMALVLAESFVLAALVWGIFNWLPMLPLDGGHMAQSLLELAMAPDKAHTAARALTVVTGLAAAIVLWVVFEAPFGAIWIALIAVLGMRAEREPPPPPVTGQEADGQEAVTEQPAAEAEQPDPPPFPI